MSAYFMMRGHGGSNLNSLFRRYQRFSSGRNLQIKSFRNSILLNIARLAVPHLSKSMGLEAPANARDMHWSKDPRGVPVARAMEDLVLPAKNIRDFRLVEEASLAERMKNIEGMGKKVSKELVMEHRPFRMLSLDGGGVRGMLTSPSCWEYVC